MLSRLAKGTRIKAALTLALLYALCVLTPSTALAFMESARAAHCLTVIHGGLTAHAENGQSHSHADAAAHPHEHQVSAQAGSEPDGQALPDQCCGLFCITALAIEPQLMPARPVIHSAVYPPLVNALDGGGPERVIRPPIA